MLRVCRNQALAPEIPRGGWDRGSKVRRDDALEIPIAGDVLDPPLGLRHTHVLSALSL